MSRGSYRTPDMNVEKNALGSRIKNALSIPLNFKKVFMIFQYALVVFSLITFYQKGNVCPNLRDTLDGNMIRDKAQSAHSQNVKEFAAGPACYIS